MAKNWIGKIKLKKGALREELGVGEDKKIPMPMLEKAAKAKGKLGKRARLALAFRGMKK